MPVSEEEAARDRRRVWEGEGGVRGHGRAHIPCPSCRQPSSISGVRLPFHITRLTVQVFFIVVYEELRVGWFKLFSGVPPATHQILAYAVRTVGSARHHDVVRDWVQPTVDDLCLRTTLYFHPHTPTKWTLRET
jgi:hypothetical protein